MVVQLLPKFFFKRDTYRTREYSLLLCHGFVGSAVVIVGGEQEEEPE